MESMEKTLMVFGQGDAKVANLKTHIGEMEATVLDNVPTLISPVPVIIRPTYLGLIILAERVSIVLIMVCWNKCHYL